DLRIGNGIVAVARPSNVGNVIRKFHVVEARLVISNPNFIGAVGSVRGAVTGPRNPNENAFLAAWRNPPERFVLPGFHQRADAVEPVRRRGKISYAVFCLKKKKSKCAR